MLRDLWFVFGGDADVVVSTDDMAMDLFNG